jgi:flagellar basal-body rod modification protein FlgD
MAATIFHHALTAGQAAAARAATPLATTTSGASGASGSSASTTSAGSATISANDFLTLLVTEMQNQDPTADTDPNEYINQLVQVNSLEQLIDINQTLSGDASGSTSSSSSSTTTSTFGGGAAEAAANATGVPAAGSKTAAIMQALHVSGGASPGSPGALGPAGMEMAGSGAARTQASPVAGNLGTQKTNPAAVRVGHALAGRTHAAAIDTAPVSAVN